MTRFQNCIVAAALALTTTPAMATSFVLDPITVPSLLPQGIDSWAVQVLPFLTTVDQVLNFSVLGDSRVDVYMLGSPSFQFSDLLLNGTSIASDFTLNNSSYLMASGYTPSGSTSLEFKGTYDCPSCLVGAVFRGYVQVSRATIPAAVPEPATWATMIVGFGLIGAAMRRRHHRAASEASIA